MSEKTIQVPWNYSPRPYQLEFLQAPQRFKIAVIHRRGGKSKTVLNEQIRKTQDPRYAGKTFYYFLPTYRQAKSVIWDSLIKEHLPMEIVEKINSSELAIYYKNGSIQRFAGVEDPSLHAGIAPIDVVFDEYSLMDPEIWEIIIAPILAENHGTATFIFTPRGKNHAHRLLQFAKQNPQTWFTMVKGVDDTNGIDEDELDKARMSMPQALFEQEFNCSFNESAGAFFRRVRENVYKADNSPERGHVYQLGIDLAKYNDYTVIAPFDLNTFKVKKLDRFNQVDWPLQEARIKSAAFRYYDAQCMMDRTGVGDSVIDHLEAEGLNIGEEGRFVFSAKSKRDLLNHLAVLLENDKIKIPDDPQLIAELESLQCELSDKGILKIVTPKGMNDDCVMALALAVWNCPQEPLGIKQLNIMPGENTPMRDNQSSLYEAI